MCRSKNAGVAGYAEAFRPVQSDSQTSEWYSYFENDVLGGRQIKEDDIPSVQKGKMFVFVPGVFLKIKVTIQSQPPKCYAFWRCGVSAK